LNLLKRLTEIPRLGAAKNFLLVSVRKRRRYTVALNVHEMGDAVAAGSFQARALDDEFCEACRS
jgi:hypothetical protein